MTRYTESKREQMRQYTIGKKVKDLEYDKKGDYYTFIFDDDSETSFRFMTDLQTTVDKK